MAFEVNRSGVYVNVWTKNEHLLFVEREKYIGSPLENVLKGNLLTLFQNAISEVFTTQQNRLLEYEVPGVNQWRSAKISYIHSDSVLILVRDISELKKNQQLILESERKFRLLAENLPGTIYLCRNDALFSMVYLNDNVQELTGYAPAEFIAGEISFVQLYHPDDAPEVYRIVEKALADRQKFVVSYRIKNRAGEYRWIEEHGIGVYENNELILIEGYLIDITDQKQKELDLVQSRNDIQSILTSLDDLVLEIDEDGVVQKIWANRPDQLFLPIDQQVGRNIRDLLPVGLANAYFQAIGNSLKSGQSFSVEYPSIVEGDDRWFHARFTAIKNLLTHKRSVSVLVQNITERKKFEQDLVLSKSNLETATHELQEQNNQLNEFNQILSHNLRSPVGNIAALISFLNENSTLDEYRDIFKRLKDTSTNLQETLNDLMETIQINRGALAERVPLRFAETIQKVKQDLAGEIISSNARIETDFSAAEEILYSKTYLESIFLNLLSNALKYRSPKRQLIIKLKTERKDDRTILRFSDNGLGIDLKKYGHQLFGLRKTFHEHRDAKGVGLFLTRTQIKAMGGQIHAESVVDQGTTFVIEF
jgi:PAS domain S-box-containing protein